MEDDARAWIWTHRWLVVCVLLLHNGWLGACHATVSTEAKNEEAFFASDEECPHGRWYVQECHPFPECFCFPTGQATSSRPEHSALEMWLVSRSPFWRMAAVSSKGRPETSGWMGMLIRSPRDGRAASTGSRGPVSAWMAWMWLLLSSGWRADSSMDSVLCTLCSVVMEIK